MKTTALISLSVAGVFALATQTQAQDAPPLSPGDPAKGEAVFNTNCNVCHAAGPGPAVAKIGAYPADHIVEILTTGVMKDMATGLTAQDKADVAAYLKTKAAPPAAAPTPGDPAKGETVFNTNCNVCHAAGPGPAVEKIGAYPADHIVEVLTTGVMKDMATGLSAQDKADVAAYLNSKASAAPAAQ